MHNDSDSSGSETTPSPWPAHAPTPPHSATLSYSSQGRGGTVHYRDHRTAFDMWWEFALPPAVAIIGVSPRVSWERDTGIPLKERDRTLEWIGDRALRDQVSSGGEFRISEMHITLFSAP